MDSFNILSKIINDLYNANVDFSNNFFNNKHNNFIMPNLKNYCIHDALNNNQFIYTIIPSYINELKKEGINLNFTDYEFDYNFRMRIKLIDTIYEKLYHYKQKELKYGKLYIAKTLNDLFGVRIVLPNIMKNEKNIINFLKNKKNENIISKYYTRNDRYYHGIHCYVKRDNKCFPWELQIWDEKCKHDNVREHKRHELERRNVL